MTITTPRMLCQYSVNDGAKVATALNAKAPMIGPAKDPVPPSTQTSSAFVDVEKPAELDKHAALEERQKNASNAG